MLKKRLKQAFSLSNANEETISPINYPDLETPVSPQVIAAAQEHASFAEDDRDLPELLNAVQEYVENHSRAEDQGNSFLERVIEDSNNRHSLRKIVDVQDGELLFAILAEGWSEIGEAINLNDRELRAVRDAHQLYADASGYSEYGSLINVLAVTIPENSPSDLDADLPDESSTEASDKPGLIEDDTDITSDGELPTLPEHTGTPDESNEEISEKPVIQNEDDPETDPAPF